MHLLGAGCVGLVHAAALQRGGVPVTLVLRRAPPHAAVAVAVARGSGTAPTTTTTQHRWTLAPRRVAALLVATRAPDTAAALAPLFAAGAISRASTLVLLQNGVEAVHAALAEHIASSGFPLPRFILGSTTHGIRRDDPQDPFSVNHVGDGETVFGAPSSEPSIDVDVFSMLAKAEGLNVTCPVEWPMLKKTLRMKLAVNSVLNPLTAIFGCRNGLVVASEEGRDLVESLCNELALLPEFRDELGMSALDLKETVMKVAKATALNRNSMDATIRRGLDTEIDYLNGHVLRMASKHGIHLPNHELVVKMVNMKLKLNRTLEN
ncbi:ketopantoate reductase PanE/ApbA C terminal-domain-containing protein [Obelidium mucronatum]|nr:ketopantoate reductase PanE/ApbA C terminal-domain-containing protein [Obelidium mucronatum]